MYNFNAIEVKIGILQLLENNNIPLPEYTRKNDEGSSFGNKDKCHALVVGSSRSSSFIIDLGASRNMASIHDSFLALHPYSGPSILMGDDLEIQAKGIDMIDLKDGYFNNVLFVPDLAMNLLFIYQMKHIGTNKRVTFTQNDVDISEISTGQVVAMGFTDRDLRMSLEEIWGLKWAL